MSQCCSPQVNGGGGWGIFNALLGWVNSATYGSVISYNLYWIIITIVFLSMRYNERTGHWPFMKAKPINIVDGNSTELVEGVKKQGKIPEMVTTRAISTGSQSS